MLIKNDGCFGFSPAFMINWFNTSALFGLLVTKDGKSRAFDGWINKTASHFDAMKCPLDIGNQNGAKRGLNASLGRPGSIRVYLCKRAFAS